MICVCISTTRGFITLLLFCECAHIDPLFIAFIFSCVSPYMYSCSVQSVPCHCRPDTSSDPPDSQDACRLHMGSMQCTSMTLQFPLSVLYHQIWHCFLLFLINTNLKHIVVQVTCIPKRWLLRIYLFLFIYFLNRLIHHNTNIFGITVYTQGSQFNVCYRGIYIQT